MQDLESKVLSCTQSLHTWIKDVAHQVTWVNRKGVKFHLGPVTAYDVARRIGAKYDLKPEKVYLHGGAAKGARYLGIKGAAVTKDQFPDAISQSPLDAMHIENFLCIHKYEIAKVIKHNC